MKSQLLLLLAGLTTAGGVALAAVSLTIAVIASTSPPVNQYLNASQNADVAANIQNMELAAALALLASLLALTQVLLRRALFRTQRMEVRGPAAAGMFLLLLMLVCLGIFAAIKSLSLSVDAIHVAAPHPITDSPAFPGLSLQFGLGSIYLAMAGSLLFWYWFGTQRATASHAVDSRRPAGPIAV